MANYILVNHLLNYAPERVSAVRVHVNFDEEFLALAAAQPRLLTPDSGTAGLKAVQRMNSTVEFSLETLKTYGVIVQP